MNRLAASIVLALGLVSAGVDAQPVPQGTSITFQGMLQQSGTPVDGLPDLEFRLFDSAMAPVGPVLSRPDWPVSGGQLTVDLDFGAVFNGAARFLQISVNGTVLTPVIPLTSAPYALSAQGTTPNAVDGVSIVDSSVGTADLGFGSVTSSDIQIGAITTAHIFDGVITENDLAFESVGIDQLKTESVSHIQIQNSTIQGEDIVGNAILGLHLADGTVTGEDIATGTIEAVDVNPALVQLRVAQQCPANESIRAINLNGTVVCEIDSIGSFSGWSLVGNSGTTPASNFIGTGDGAPLRIQAVGGVGINTTAPLATLHVRKDSPALVNATPDPGTIIAAERPVGNAFVSIMGSAQRGLVFGEPNNIADGGLYYDLAGNGLLDLRTGGNTSRLAVGIADVDGAAGVGPVNSLQISNVGGTAGYISMTQGFLGAELNFGFAGNPGRFQVGGVVSTFRSGLLVDNVLQVTGNVTMSGGNLTLESGTAVKPGGGSWGVFSDARLKHHVEPLEGALDRLLALRGVHYEYLPSDSPMRPAGRHTGFIAQEVRALFPDWVAEDKTGYLTVAPRGFEALTVEALRDLKAEQDVENEALRSENAALRAEFAAMRAELAAMRAGRDATARRE
ncbi:MAG TPA: tail fiber domain-containing protein [Candidatus Saccharimonadia bacterium]|nr:tail fiber domain-containing protein [Candidatus Saccharimonadia bacterium]